jgi:hypothetical protein
MKRLRFIVMSSAYFINRNGKYYSIEFYSFINHSSQAKLHSMLKKIIAVTPFVTCITLMLEAQFVSGKNEVGINIGAFVYQGDLTPASLGSFKTMKPQLSIYHNRILNPYFSVRVNFATGSLKGDESKYSYKPYRQIRNFNFTTSVKELSVLMVWSAYGNNLQSNFVRFSPYVFAGLGYTALNIRRDWSNLDISSLHPGSHILTGLATDTMHSVPKGLPVLPLGIGVKYAISPRISLTAETMYRYAFTDYLDGFSYSANPDRKDSYYSISIGLRYNFGRNKMKCPPVRR